MYISFSFFKHTRVRAALLTAVCAGLVGVAGCPRGTPRDPKKSQTRVDLAKDFLSKGQLEAAATEADKALAFDPRNDEAHFVLGLVDFRRGLDTHRLIEVDNCLTGVDAEALRREFDTQLQSADKHLATAAEISNDYGEPWAARGVVATLREDYALAVELLKRALGLPARLQNIALVRANLGWAYFHLGDHVAAAKELLQSTQFQPGMCVATYRLGRVYFARKEWEKALEKFLGVVREASCPIQEAHLFLMKTYVELGQTEGLSEMGRACAALAPRSCIAAQCRAIAARFPGQADPGAAEPGHDE